MENNRPLLSICIPTYNRCSILEETLRKFCDNNEFDDNVEIVISDNCSTDSTQEICERFAKTNPRIRYNRNTCNINDTNFSIVLDLAQGEYLKLLNDCVYLDDEGLKYIKDKIRENLFDKYPMYFTSNWIDTKFKNVETCICNNLDDYLNVVSTYVTSNNLFGIWQEQWKLIKDKCKYSELKLQQVDWTFQNIAQCDKCVVYNKKIFNTVKQPLGIRKGYNWFQVHLINYYIIIETWYRLGYISTGTLRKDKHHLLSHFKNHLELALIYNYSKYWKYDTENTWYYLFIHYGRDPYFYLFIVRLYIMFFLKIPIKLIRLLGR